MEEDLKKLYQRVKAYDKINDHALELIFGECGEDDLGRYKDSYRDYKDRGKCRCMLFSS